MTSQSQPFLAKAIGLAALAAALALSGCYRNDTSRTNTAVLYDDTPARVTCVGYGGLMFDGQTKGAVEYDEGGRVSFIDAETGHLVKTEGECVVRYAK